MKNKSILLLACVAAVLMSCKTQIITTTRTVQEPQYLGNGYKEMKGYTENQILRTMSSPTRTESDGAGGKILVYEEKQIKTDTNSSYTTSSRTSGGATTTVGQKIWTGAPQANTTASSATTTRHNTSGQSVTYEEKAFVNFFINTKGICYDVATNVGDRYSEKITETVCYEGPKAMSPLVLITLIPPMTLVGIPLSIAYAVQKSRANNPDNFKLVECQ